MKASLKFREEKKPVFRAKVPINILGFPFQSGIIAGESKELSLNLSTFFDSGPCFKVAYRPNDSLNPFSLVFKTGIGSFGSPISSPMTMSAEFNLINQNPSFFVHLKPQFGDFTIKKSQSSMFVKNLKSKTIGVVSDDDGSVEVVQMPILNCGNQPEIGLFSGKKITVFQPESPTARVVQSVFSGMELSARTALPLRNRAMVNFRWGFRFPAEGEAMVLKSSNRTVGISFQKLPLLVMDKISIEHIASDDSTDSRKVGPDLESPRNAELAEACITVKRQLELIQAENGMLRKAMDDLRSEIGAATGGVEIGKYRDGERGMAKSSGGKFERRSNGDKKSSEFNGFGGKAMEGNHNEDLKKATMVATSG